jgi:hypothetical protein
MLQALNYGFETACGVVSEEAPQISGVSAA